MSDLASPPVSLAERPCIQVSEFAQLTGMSPRTARRWLAAHGVARDAGRVWLAELREKAFQVWNSLIQADAVREASK